MASDSDLDRGDYYIVEDDNESASFEYVPCVNYPNDKVYPEDEKNGGLRSEEDTGTPNIYMWHSDLVLPLPQVHWGFTSHLTGPG